MRTKKNKFKEGGGQGKKKLSNLSLFLSFALVPRPNFLDKRAQKRLPRRLLLRRGGGGEGAYEWGRSSGRLRYTYLPFITGLFIWGLGTGLSETGTVSTDLLGSFALPGCGLGGDPTKVKSTLDTELWKNVVQFGTLGYFTSETKIVCFSTIWFKVRENGQSKMCSLFFNIELIEWRFTIHVQTCLPTNKVVANYANTDFWLD